MDDDRNLVEEVLAEEFNMKKIERLFLDDVRPRPDGWAVARSFGQFERIIELYGVPEIISFDHDLGVEHYKDADGKVIDYSKYTEKTGYDCAQLLIARKEFPKLAFVHSFNRVGAMNIANLLSPHCPVVIQPYRREHFIKY